jgi:hypothetical protein
MRPGSDGNVQDNEENLPRFQDRPPRAPRNLGSLLLRLVELEREREELLTLMEDSEIVSIRLPLSGRKPIR